MNISLVRPVKGGWVSQWFGPNAQAYKAFGLAGHNGLDYAVDEGTPVYAAHRGVVRHYPDDVRGYGKYCRVEGEKFSTVYGHLSAYVMEDGALVEPGDVIAKSGNTGNSTGPHLHFGLRVNSMNNPAYGNYIDPAPFRDV